MRPLLSISRLQTKNSAEYLNFMNHKSIQRLIYYVTILTAMLWFSKKKPEIVEYTTAQRLSRIEARVTNVEAQILDLATAQNIMRNKVLKKIQFKNPKEDEEEAPKREDLNSKVLLPEP